MNPNENLGVISGAFEGYADLVPHVVSVVLLMLFHNSAGINESRTKKRIMS